MVYFDSNVLLYLYTTYTDGLSLAKKERTEFLLNEHENQIILSINVLNEISSNLFRPKFYADGVEPFSEREILKITRTLVLMSKDIYRPTTQTVYNAIRYRREVYGGKKPYYDAMHLANAKEAGARILYTEDKHFGVKEDDTTLCGIEVKNAFRNIV